MVEWSERNPYCSLRILLPIDDVRFLSMIRSKTFDNVDNRDIG